MSYLQIKNVCKGFGSGSSRTEVLSNIDLEVEEGEFVAILGYSGTGKSTLMNLIAGLESPDSGEILVDGKRVEGPSPERGMVFQNYSLLPWLNVGSNVGVAVDEVWSGDSKARRETRIDDALAMVKLTDAKHKLPAELSGGMRQRNSVARTLSMRPGILLLDEPLSALDAITRAAVQDQILQIWKEDKQTIVLITNDVDEGIYMADRIIPLSMGPAASLGPETPVEIPRPRSRRELAGDLDVARMRNEIIDYLLSQKAKQNADQPTRSVSLPNIRPMDISMARPSNFLGLRPRPKKVLEPKH